jgi:formylmethanofuran dehydrogenase subunit E
MERNREYPADFQRCVDFHGHICPGLAIGYSASRAALSALEAGRSEDEEIVAIVENDSCAVDAVQTLTGCTFGKGNLVFRDWGKQVYTFFDRKKGRAVRLSLKSHKFLGHEERKEIRERMERGDATQEDMERMRGLKEQAVFEFLTSQADEFFRIEFVDIPPPAEARVVETRACKICGEETMVSRMEDSHGQKICRGCHLEQDDKF